jgi:hypothetical protein
VIRHIHIFLTILAVATTLADAKDLTVKPRNSTDITHARPPTTTTAHYYDDKENRKGSGNMSSKE